METIQIVLAAYNSAGFVNGMLASIEAQDFSDWLVIVRDDGSTDGTAELLAVWQQRLGKRMRLIPNPDGINLGIAGNFTRLLEEVSSRYFMIADGDDIWHPNKIRLSFLEIQKLEAESLEEKIFIVHTDMKIIDGEDRLIASSSWKYAGIKPRFSYPLIEMIFSNVVCGPSVIANRRLLDIALPIPSEARVEDWWLALVAAAFGTVVPLTEKTLSYRRHSNNASELPEVTLLNRVRGFAKIRVMRRRLYALLEERLTISQAFLNRYGESLAQGDKAALEALVSLPTSSWFFKRHSIVVYRLWFNSLAVNVAYFLLV